MTYQEWANLSPAELIKRRDEWENQYTQAGDGRISYAEYTRLYDKAYGTKYATSTAAQGASSPQPSPSAGPTGQVGPAIETGLAPGALLGEVAPEALYRQKFNLPAFGLSPMQEWLANQYAPTATMFAAQSRLPQSTAAGATPLTFADYLNQTNIGQARAAAPGVMKSLQGLTVPEQIQFEKELGQGALGRLLGTALGQKYGGGWGELMGSQAATGYRPYFEAQDVQQPGAEAYMSYLMKRYGM